MASYVLALGRSGQVGWHQPTRDRWIVDLWGAKTSSVYRALVCWLRQPSVSTVQIRTEFRHPTASGRPFSVRAPPVSPGAAGRIPNFDGATQAGELARRLQV